MSASRPYVDRPVTDRDAAHDAADALARLWGLPSPKLLRHGMNSLYLAGGVVVRVGTATAPAAASHDLARWLIEAGIPTVPPAEGLTADRDGFAVTGWQFVRETRRAIDWRAVGAAVRRVHALDVRDVPEGYPVPDPSTFPWWAFDELLDDVAGELDAAAHDAIRATIDRHRGWRDDVRRAPVLCHGDVHPGNVLMSGSGPLLVDWDLLCVADPAWDHAMLTTYAERWGGDEYAYAAFADGYGRSLADDELTIALGALRNVAATIMRVRAGRTDPAAAEEAANRLRWWRGDPDAPTWRAQ